MKPRDTVVYLCLAGLWGFSFLVILHVVEAFGWVGAVTLRSFVATATLLGIAFATRRKLHFKAAYWPLAVVGATTVAGQLIGLSYATPRIGTAMAAILVAATPLFSMLISQVWGLERITAQRLAGLVLGASGIVLLVGFPTVPVTGEFALGCASTLFASFCAAFGSNYASRHLRQLDSWEVTIGSFLFGGFFTLPLLVAVPVPGTPKLGDYGYLIALGGLMSALAYVLYFRLVASVGPTRAISVEFVVTVVAVAVGSSLLHESLSAVQLAGAAIIITGCMLVLGLIPLPFARKAAG